MCREVTTASLLTYEQQEQLYDRLKYLYLCFEDVVDSASALHRMLERISWYHEEPAYYQACYLAMMDAPIEEPTRSFALDYFKCAYENSMDDETNEYMIQPSQSLEEIEMYQ